MPIAAFQGLSDTLLVSLLQGAQSAAGARDLASLFLPPQLDDATAHLSATDLAALLGTARNLLLGLSTAAGPLDLANPTSVFFAATVASSDGAAVQGDVIAGTSVDTTPESASYRFTVSQLAVAQANVGSALGSDATSAFAVGTNTVRVTQKGVATDVSFTVGATDSNLTVLTALASALDDAGLGVTASVRTDAGAGTSQLIVQAATTGTANGFSLADVTGTAVADAGVSSAATAAVDAAFTQDGVALTSSTNEFYLGTHAKLKVTLVGTTASPVVLTVAPDRSLVGSAVSSLVGAYDEARSFFDAAPEVYQGASAQLASVVSRLRGQLATIGIQVGADRSLSIDATKLSNAIAQSPAAVERVLGDVGGLAKELGAIADTQLRQPSSVTTAPPFQSGYGPQLLAGWFATRLAAMRYTGLLVDALI